MADINAGPGYYSTGTVKIIPATAMRDQQFCFDPSNFYHQQDTQHSYPQPINVAYYMSGGMYNVSAAPGYLHEPYGQNAYIDQYGENVEFPFYGNYTYSPYAYQNQGVHPGAYGPYAGASSAYRPYPQPQPSPPRRSRTAPNRSGRSSIVYPTDQRRTRGYSAAPYENRRIPTTAHQKPFYIQTFKKQAPVYKKRREPTTQRTQIQETDFGGGTLEYNAYNSRYYPETTQQQTLRRIRPYYAPSYATYPPSTMHKTSKKLDTKRYPLYARIILKFAQLIIGAAILGLVLGPMKGTTFHDFVVRNHTEWQGLVIGIVSCWGILTAILLITSCLANKVHAWRKLDAHINLIGILAYLLVSCMEAYYAACPNGPLLKAVCHRAEWIIATILCFINVVLYVIDFTLSWFSGVTML